MEAIKLKGVARNGVLLVAVPKEFEEKELEVIVLSEAAFYGDISEESHEVTDRLNAHEARVQRLMSIVGAAEYPEFPASKYDVYEQ